MSSHLRRRRSQGELMGHVNVCGASTGKRVLPRRGLFNKDQG